MNGGFLPDAEAAYTAALARYQAAVAAHQQQLFQAHTSGLPQDAVQALARAAMIALRAEAELLVAASQARYER